MRFEILSLALALMTSAAAAPLFPHTLATGDSVAVVSPASIIRPPLVYTAVPALRSQGWEIYATEDAFARQGSYAGSDSLRAADFRRAWMEPNTRALMCSRGGYGAVHILDSIAALPLDDPKWVIGFSDITAIHSVLTSRGVVSIHAPMVKPLGRNGGNDSISQSLFSLLRGGDVDIAIGPHGYNRRGVAEGTLVGGNLSVLAGLIGTPYDVIRPGVILFVEDISEPAYKIERILWQLRLCGVLPHLAGLIVGHFRDCPGDIDHASVYDVIADMTAEYDFPVAYGFPVGHVVDNRPLLCGAPAVLSVGENVVTLRQQNAATAR